MKGTQPDRVRVGALEIDLRAGELRSSRGTVRLQEQPFKILVMLIEHDGAIVTRDEIQHKLWPNDTVVEYDSGINAAIKKLRTAFEDSADAPKYIETVARRGYRLMQPVEAAPTPAPAPAAAHQPVESETVASGGHGNLIGKKVSHYRVLEVLGGGAMGVVYKAEDLKLGRQVALKFLPDEMLGDALARKRFRREARSGSLFDHPNICTFYDADEWAGQPFLVMQLLQGETLREHLMLLNARRERLPLAELLDIALQVCDGMQAAHDRGLMHRDIKPANIFLMMSGQVKILDFGLAKLFIAADSSMETLGDLTVAETSTSARAGRTDPSEKTTAATGVALGTVGYMSPEQIRGERLDSRTDIFSFGVLLYEMASGGRAFAGDDPAEIRTAALTKPPRALAELVPEIVPELEAVINKAIEKDREHRYQSVAEMRHDLEALQPADTDESQSAQSRRGWSKFGDTARRLFGSSASSGK
jgi:serine/threonine protein kinase